MRMRFLCKIGVHQWRLAGYANLVFPSGVEQCQRCGKGRMHFMEATIHYTAAQMALQGKHGTPQEFEAAVWHAFDHGYIETVEQAAKAIEDYAEEFNGYRGLRPDSST